MKTWQSKLLAAAYVAGAVAAVAGGRVFAFDYVNTFAPVTTEILVAIAAAVAAIALPFAIILGVRLALNMYRKFTAKV